MDMTDEELQEHVDRLWAVLTDTPGLDWVSVESEFPELRTTELSLVLINAQAQGKIVNRDSFWYAVPPKSDG